MAGLVPAISTRVACVFLIEIAGTSPAMTFNLIGNCSKRARAEFRDRPAPEPYFAKICRGSALQAERVATAGRAKRSAFGDHRQLNEM
jgi:hypothetical protein